MKNFFVKFMETNTSNWSSLLIRVPLGLSFSFHGWGKLFGAHNPEGFAGFLSKVGIEPSYLFAVLTGITETFGGMFIIIGLFTRFVAASHVILMTVIILAVHIKQPIFGQGSFELQLFMLIMSVILLIQGGGKFSADALITRKQSEAL